MNTRQKRFIVDNIRYLGVAGISILLDKTVILVDPYLNIDLPFIKKISGGKKIHEIHIYISHGHYDHYKFVADGIQCLKDTYLVKVFLPADVYGRDAVTLNESAVVSRLNKKRIEEREYSAGIIAGRHYKMNILFKISKLFNVANYSELKTHFSFPADDMMNFIFTIKTNGVKIGHIGSPALSEAAEEKMKGLDILCLSMLPMMNENVGNIRKLLPSICMPIHHQNRISGLRLLGNYGVDKLKKVFNDGFLEKEVFNDE